MTTPLLLLLQSLAEWFRSDPLLTVLLLTLGPPLAALLVASRQREVAAPVDADAPPVAPPPIAEASEPEPEPVATSVPQPSPPSPPSIPAPAPPKAPPVGLGQRLARTSEALVGRLGSLLGSRRVDAEMLDDLEAMLFGADLGVSTTDALLAAVRERASGGDLEQVKTVLRDEVATRLAKIQPERPGLRCDARPHVVLVLGVNGSGKTTTIGKLAARYAGEGKRVVVGAGDTFRAAAIDQLAVWAERVGCEIVRGQPGGDPAAVAFDTVEAAKARDCDVAIIDTAGRLQTKQPLIDELRKMVRVIGRADEGAPHETLLVLDANTGQNAISQAKVFTEAAGVTGLVLTKLDGTAKGGVLVGLADEYELPVRFIGVGEGVEDLRDFDANEFVAALFGDRVGAP